MHIQPRKHLHSTRLTRLCFNAYASITRYYNVFRVYIEPLVQPFLPQWSAIKNRARVQKVNRLGQGFVQLQIKTPRKWKGFRPGQFVQLGIFKQGAELRRIFSISSSPAQFLKSRTIELTIQVRKNGRVTPWIFDRFKVGGVVTLSRASGDFILDPTKPALMIAGGYGLTPFLSFLGSSRDEPALLLHYSKNPSVFDGLFAPLNPADFRRMNTTQRGRFSKEDLQTLCPDYLTRDIYLCGPEAMIEDVSRLLLALGCKSERIHAERFSPPRSNAESDITLGGESASLHFEKSDRHIQASKRPILELAEEAGLRAQFGCRMGVCDQCKCKKKSGLVYNLRTQRVSDSGPEEIKICVSVPINHVVLDL